MATQTEAFLDEMMPRQLAADRALHQGDVGPRLAGWSHEEPVTLFGAGLTGSGWEQLEGIFRRVASWFSESESYEFELLAAGASGDLAYTVAREHNTVKVEGETRSYTLRVTHVYRREDGAWKIVHRHADPERPDRPIADVLAEQD